MSLVKYLEALTNLCFCVRAGEKQVVIDFRCINVRNTVWSPNSMAKCTILLANPGEEWGVLDT